MPDITKCANKMCPLKDTCYRFTAEPSLFRQAYCNFSYDTIENHTICDHFWDNKDKKI